MLNDKGSPEPIVIDLDSILLFSVALGDPLYVIVFHEDSNLFPRLWDKAMDITWKLGYRSDVHFDEPTAYSETLSVYTLTYSL